MKSLLCSLSLTDFWWSRTLWITEKECNEVWICEAYSCPETWNSHYFCRTRSNGLCPDRIRKNGKNPLWHAVLIKCHFLSNANLWFCCGLSVIVITYIIDCLLALCHHTGGLPAAHPTAADGWWSGSQQVQRGAGARGHNRGPHQRAHQSDLSGGQEVCIWVRIF